MESEIIKRKQQEKEKIIKKYLAQCAAFGVEPTDNYEKKIDDVVFGCKDNISKDAARTEALNVYFDYIDDFKFPASAQLDEMSTAEIWSEIIYVENKELKNKFGALLSTIEDPIQKRRVKECLEALYDQRIYPNHKDFETLFENSESEETIRKAFAFVGGDESLLLLSENITEDDEPQDDEEEIY